MVTWNYSTAEAVLLVVRFDLECSTQWAYARCVRMTAWQLVRNWSVERRPASSAAVTAAAVPFCCSGREGQPYHCFLRLPFSAAVTFWEFKVATTLVDVALSLQVWMTDLDRQKRKGSANYDSIPFDPTKLLFTVQHSNQSSTMYCTVLFSSPVLWFLFSFSCLGESCDSFYMPSHMIMFHLFIGDPWLDE